MDPQCERRRNPNVPRPNGQRWTDRLLSRRGDHLMSEERLWLWGAKLWAAAALAGVAYGASWVDGLM